MALSSPNNRLVESRLEWLSTLKTGPEPTADTKFLRKARISMRAQDVSIYRQADLMRSVSTLSLVHRLRSLLLLVKRIPRDVLLTHLLDAGGFMIHIGPKVNNPQMLSQLRNAGMNIGTDLLVLAANMS